MAKVKKILNIAIMVLALGASLSELVIALRICPLAFLFGNVNDVEYRKSMLRISIALILVAICMIICLDYKKNKIALIIFSLTSAVPLICSLIFSSSVSKTIYVCYALLLFASFAGAAFVLYGVTKEEVGKGILDIAVASALAVAPITGFMVIIITGGVNLASLIVVLFSLPIIAAITSFELMRSIRKKKGIIRIIISALSFITPALLISLVSVCAETIIPLLNACTLVFSLVEIYFSVKDYKRASGSKIKEPQWTE